VSNLFKKVRIIHSPLQRRYYVEKKSLWSFRWTTTDSYEYVEARSTLAMGCHDLAEDAFQRAQKRAETILAQCVVWEKSNFTVYP
jgi:hypothetical protein